MPTTPQASAPDAPHRLTLDARRSLTVSGVTEIDSFDEAAVCLRTSRGPLTVRGRGLHLQQLSIGGGEVLVDGVVDAIIYEDDAPAGGFFARLFG